MKQPRASAFDPHAPQERAESPVVERALASPLDDFPAIAEPHQSATPSILPDREGLPDRDDRGDLNAASGLSIPPTTTENGASETRKMKPRHAFDIYQDQFETLRQLALEDRMRGGPGSMSAMVRRAIDDYISQARQQATSAK